MSLVVVKKTDGLPDVPTLRGYLQQLLVPFGGLGNFVFPQARVLIKPHIGALSQGQEPAITNVNLLEALILELKAAGAKEIMLGETTLSGLSAAEIYAIAGYSELGERLGVTTLDLDHDEEDMQLPVPNPLQLDAVKVFKKAVGADVLINLPIIKTALALPINISMSNLLGLIPYSERKRSYYQNLNRSVVDIAQVLVPQLTIVDGLMINQLGVNLPHNLLLAGTDMIALDTVAAWSCGIDSQSVEYLCLADSHGIGEMDDISLNWLDGTPISPMVPPMQQHSHEITDLIDTYPGLEFVAGDVCPSCASILTKALHLAAEAGSLEAWQDNLVIALGSGAPVPETEKKVLYIGNCLQHQEPAKNHILGCPILYQKIVEFLSRV